MRRLLAIARKELIQLRRDRMTLGMMVGFPVMQLLLFGYAINTDVRNIARALLAVRFARGARHRGLAAFLEEARMSCVRMHCHG